jgi:dihydrofolate synthase/folylpolyglutamate synthase
VSVITDIALDHQKFLGDTIAEIAREKAGIIRPSKVVVTLPQLPQANDVIGNTILELGARGVSAAQYVPPVSPAVSIPWNPSLNATLEPEAAREGHGFTRAVEPNTGRALAPEVRASYPLQVLGKEILVETPLVGRHQLRNIALAIAAAEELSKQGFPVTAETIERGIRETHWPGRFQVIPRSEDQPEIIFDVAHNPAGAWALRSTLSAAYENRQLIFVFGAMRDKAIAEVAEILFPLAERVVATQADNPRSASPSEIREAGSRTGAEIEEAPDVAEALAKARVLAGSDGVIVVTGSIYIVGEVMRQLGARIQVSWHF